MERYKLLLFIGLAIQAFHIHGQIIFSNQADQVGLGESGPNYGVAIADYDRDGWEDIYITRRPGANRLFKNIGGTFVDVASSAGVDVAIDTKMAIWGDFDNDGWVDLFLANKKGIGDMLFKNNGQGSFTDVSTQAGIDHKGDPFAAIAGDINNDGFLDIYIAHFDGPNVLWKNNGNMTFSNMTQKSGAISNKVAMGATFVDFDNDGDLDLYLTHDAYGPNTMYANDGLGNFTDVSVGIGADIAAFGMGVDVGDINNDGWFDLYITNLYPNNLLLNQGNGSFIDIRDSAGVGDPGMGWGTAFLDADNDGFQDIYAANTLRTPNVLYRNRGDSTFELVSGGTVLSSTRGNGYGVATFDYNKDGKVDILLANSNDTLGVQLFRNDGQQNNHWLEVALQSDKTNVSAIGAKVELMGTDLYRVDVVSGGSSWAAQHSQILHFGLKDQTVVDSLKITWPNGEVEIYRDVQADQIFQARQLGDPASIEKAADKLFQLVVNGGSLGIFLNDLEGSAAEISITRMNGQIMFRKQLSHTIGPHNLELDTQTWSAGMYFITLMKNGSRYSQKLIIR